MFRDDEALISYKALLFSSAYCSRHVNVYLTVLMA